MNSTKSKTTTIVSTTIWLCLALYLFVQGISLIDDAITMSLILFFLGFVFGSIAFVLWAILSREFIIDEKGIHIRYLSKIQLHYPWDKITNVYVCDVNHAPKDARNFDLVIRIVIGKEQHGPLSDIKSTTLIYKKEKWRTWGYWITKFTNIILVEYSKERLDEIRKLYGHEILYFLTPLGKDRIKTI